MATATAIATRTSEVLELARQETAPADLKERWEWAVQRYARLTDAVRWAGLEKGRVASAACGDDEQSIRSFAAEVGESKTMVAMHIINWRFYSRDEAAMEATFNQGGTLKLLDVARRSAHEHADLFDQVAQLEYDRNVEAGLPVDRPEAIDRYPVALEFISRAMTDSLSSSQLRALLKSEAAELRNRVQQAQGMDPAASEYLARRLAQGHGGSWREYGPESTWGPWGGSPKRDRIPGELVIDIIAAVNAQTVLDPYCINGSVESVCQDMNLTYGGGDPALGDTAQDILTAMNGGQVDLLFANPPAWDDIVGFTGEAADPSNAQNVYQYENAVLSYLGKLWEHAVRPGGHMAVALHDIVRQGTFVNLTRLLGEIPGSGYFGNGQPEVVAVLPYHQPGLPRNGAPIAGEAPFAVTHGLCYLFRKPI